MEWDALFLVNFARSWLSPGYWVSITPVISAFKSYILIVSSLIERTISLVYYSDTPSDATVPIDLGNMIDLIRTQLQGQICRGWSRYLQVSQLFTNQFWFLTRRSGDRVQEEGFCNFLLCSKIIYGLKPASRLCFFTVQTWFPDFLFIHHLAILGSRRDLLLHLLPLSVKHSKITDPLDFSISLRISPEHYIA